MDNHTLYRLALVRGARRLALLALTANNREEIAEEIATVFDENFCDRKATVQKAWKRVERKLNGRARRGSESRSSERQKAARKGK